MAVKFTKSESHKISKVKVTDHELGRGSYATVFEVRYKGQKCAGKKIHEALLKQGSESYPIQRFEEECHLLSQVNHPNIVRFMGVYYPKGSSVPILVMEFLPVNLTYCIEKEPVLPIEINYSILHDVAKGFYHLHTQTPPIVHRDLSSNNILLTTNLTAKISDLGVARILDMTPLQDSHMTQTPGTPAYMPPEVMVEKPKYDTSIDNFSYGILMIHMLSHKWPVPQVGQIRTVGDKLIPVTEAERRQTFLESIGSDHPLMELILRCISNNPQLRPATKEIMDELAKLTRHNPLTQNATLVPVESSVANKGRRKEKKRLATDYNYVEVESEDKFTHVARQRSETVSSKDKSWIRKRKILRHPQQTKQVADRSSKRSSSFSVPRYKRKSRSADELSFSKKGQSANEKDKKLWLAQSWDPDKKVNDIDLPNRMPVEIAYPVHAALYDYKSSTIGDLSFNKGDLLYIIHTDKKDRWFARCKGNGQEGYVPTNYVTQTAVDINNTLYVNKWFFDSICRSETERVLLSSLNQRGSFLIRKSETTQDVYVLSLRCSDDTVRHYRIKQLCNGPFSIYNDTTFESISVLVAYYQHQAGKLHEQLLLPCVMSAPVMPPTEDFSCKQ